MITAHKKNIIGITVAIACLSGIIISCNKNAKVKVPDEPLIYDCALPVTLVANETKVFTQDFLLDQNTLDSVAARPWLNATLSPDKKIITLKEVGKTLPSLITMQLYCKGYAYTVVLQKSQKKKHEFKFVNLGEAPQKVQVAGDFNGWTPTKDSLIFNGKEWTMSMNLNPGKYAYQLVVDGKWMLDPSNPEKLDNNIGGVNSLLNIKDVDENKLPKIFTQYADAHVIRIRTVNEPQKFIVLWNNFDITDLLTSYKDNILEVTIPKEAYNLAKSCIRVWSYNKEGSSNDINIPLKQGNVVKNHQDLSRDDKRSMIMYFMMVDRFVNGDKENDAPINDNAILPKANYMGGDIEGINQEIKNDYFLNLGINTLWISPIVQNPLEGYVEYPAPHRKYSGYHGYWPISFSKVDSRFGNDKVLMNTVKNAHAKGINILLDFVSNHVHQKHPIYITHPEWTTPIDLPDGRKNIRLWDEERLTTWFDTFLPDLDYTKPEVVNAITDSAMYWLTKFDIDGFRHDATKHVSEDFWRALTYKIKLAVKKNNSKSVYQIGETFGSRELIGSYVNNGEQDAQFDFNLYFDARSNFVNDKESFTKLTASLRESFNYYGWHSVMGNITGNHDIARFISYAGEGMQFKDDDKETGWSKNITVKNPVGYKKLGQLVTFIATIPGIPVIYYGDEIGMPGAGDPDNRRMMKFNNLLPLEAQQLEITQKILNARKTSMALTYGDFDLLKVTDNFMAYGRYYFGETALVFFNKSNQSQKIKVTIPADLANASFKKLFDSKWSIDGNNLIIEMLPHSFEILKTEQ